MKEVKFIELVNILMKVGITISDDIVPAFIDSKSEDFSFPITSANIEDKTPAEAAHLVLTARIKHLAEVKMKKDDEANTKYLTKLFKKEADCHGTSYNKDGRAMFEETFVRIVKEFLNHDR